MNLLQTYQLDIIDGRWLFRMLVPEIIEYVENKKSWNQKKLQYIF